MLLFYLVLFCFIFIFFFVLLFCFILLCFVLWVFLVLLLIAIFFIGPAAVAARVLLNRVCPFFRPSVCLGVFLECYYQFFLNFDMVLENLHFCCVPAQITYSGKLWFLRYGSRYSQPIRLQDFLINHISRTSQWNNLIFLHVDKNSYKLKITKKFFGVDIQKWVQSILSQDSKMGFISRMDRWTNLIFLLSGANPRKLKVISLIFGWMWSDMGVAI